MIIRTVALAVTFILVASMAWAEPVLEQSGMRTATELVLYTGASFALVRQSSMLRLAEGANTVAFAWTGDKIDAASVRLHAPADVSVGEVVRPAGAATTLQWTLTPQAPGITPITVVYQLAGISWKPAWRLTWEPGAADATLQGWVTVTNGSGLDLASVRAQIVLGRPGADAADQLSFPIAGLTDLPAGASVRATFVPTMALGARVIYRIDSEAAPEQVRRRLGVQPPTAGLLAREPLPTGPLTVALTSADGPDQSLATELKYEPGEEFEIDLGVARDIVVERRLLAREKLRMEFDRLGRVSGFDTVESYLIEVRNHGHEDANLEIVEAVVDTAWEFETRALHVTEPGRVIMHLSVAPGERGHVQFTITKHSGTRIP